MGSWNLINNEKNPVSRFPEEIIWTIEENGKFSLKSAYNAISGFDVNPFPWVDKIWFKGCICKHSLCAWMIFRGCLETNNFLAQCDTCCVFCSCTWETTDHILINCLYSQWIRGKLMSKFLLKKNPYFKYFGNGRFYWRPGAPNRASNSGKTDFSSLCVA